MSNHIFTGSGVALITPMKSDGSVNYDVLGDLVEFHVQNGTDAIIVCGTCLLYTSPSPRDRG